MTKRAGFLCYNTAPPEVLRVHALGIYGMRAYGDGAFSLGFCRHMTLISRSMAGPRLRTRSRRPRR